MLVGKCDGTSSYRAYSITASKHHGESPQKIFSGLYSDTSNAVAITYLGKMCIYSLTRRFASNSLRFGNMFLLQVYIYLIIHGHKSCRHKLIITARLGTHSFFLVSHVLALLMVLFLIMAIMFFSISSLPFSRSRSSRSYLASLLFSQIYQTPTMTTVTGIVTTQYIQNCVDTTGAPESWKLKKVIENTEAR
jgi:hypothetical protein